MSLIFLLDPLSSEPLLQEVLGQPAASMRPVVLEDVGTGNASDALAMPQIDAQSSATALAIEVEDPAAFDRLSFFAAVLGAHPVPKHGHMDGHRVSGVLFVDDTADGPGNLTAAPSDLALLAAREIMGYHGRRPAADVTHRLPMIFARAAATLAAKTTPTPTIRSQATQDDVIVHASDATHEGFFLTRTYDLQHPRFDGSTSARLSREVFVATDAVIVLPYDPVRDRVLLVEQFRMGPFARGDTYPWVLEPVAGRVDAGETVEEAARRECEEEAGLTLRHLEHVSSHYFSPGASTEYYHCYVALSDLPDGVAGQGGLDAEHEDIRTHVLSFDAVQDLLTSGEANIGPLILLLLWLERERPRLRASA